LTPKLNTVVFAGVNGLGGEWLIKRRNPQDPLKNTTMIKNLDLERLICGDEDGL